MINVTRSSLPPLEQYVSHLKKLWASRQLTNGSVLSQELESALKVRLRAPYLHYVGNGTLALQIAMRALDVRDEVITTPFSYVATTSAILWENCKPVFADIQPRDFNIDVEKIEALITERTTAILAVHVFGFPCDVRALQVLATKHGLKLIYDAAHAFGVEIEGRPISDFGDVSTFSFHATKLFHTVEGGAIVSHDAGLAERIYLMRSFGHRGDEHFLCGINAKNSEFHAAMGLCLLPALDDFIDARRRLTELYDHELKGLPITRPQVKENVRSNYAYLPMIFATETIALRTQKRLSKEGVAARRYFFPSINELPYLRPPQAALQTCPISEDISRRILCLPLFPELEPDSVVAICRIVRKMLEET